MIGLIRRRLDCNIDDSGNLRIAVAPTTDDVEKIATRVINSWPKDSCVDLGDLGSGLDLLFWGRRTPRALATTVTRLSLYSDRILVVNPFVDSFLFHPENSPTVCPEIWRNTYLHFCAFLLLLEPWIEAGLVEVLPNPANLDLELRRKLQGEFSSSLAGIEHGQGPHGFYLETIAEMVATLPKEEIDAYLRAAVPPASRKDVKQRIKAILDGDPVRASLPVVDPGVRQLLGTGTGMGVPMASVLATEHGLSLVTDEKRMHRALHKIAPAFGEDDFALAGQAFAETELRFLNNVPPDVALEIRRQGGLVKFREYLRSIGVKTRDELPDYKRFAERLKSEYEDYKAVWRDLQSELGVGTLLSGSVLGTGGAMVMGSLEIGALGVVAGLAQGLVRGVVKRRAFERRPLGVLLRVDQAKQRVKRAGQ